MTGRHVAPKSRARDLIIFVGGIIVVGAVVFGLLWWSGTWRAGRTADATTTSVAAVAVTTTTTTPTTATVAPTTTAAPTTTVAPTSTTIALRPTDEVRVLVLNAVGVAGLAAEVTERLESLGYQTLTPANYQPTLEQSRVWYHAGFAPEAFELAGAVAPDALIEENADLTPEADIVVVLGTSYEG